MMKHFTKMLFKLTRILSRLIRILWNPKRLPRISR